MHNDPIHKRSWDLEVVCVFMDRISNISNITTLLLLKVMYNICNSIHLSILQCDYLIKFNGSN